MDAEFQEYYSAQQQRIQELRARIANERQVAAPHCAPTSASTNPPLDRHTLNDETELVQTSGTVWRSLNGALVGFADEEARLDAGEQILRDEEQRLAERRRAALKRKSILLAALHTIASREESLQHNEKTLRQDEADDKEEANLADERHREYEKLLQETREKLVAKRLLVERHRAELAAQSERQDAAEREQMASIAAWQSRIEEIDRSTQRAMDALVDRERVVQCAEAEQRAAIAHRLAQIALWLEHCDTQTGE